MVTSRSARDFFRRVLNILAFCSKHSTSLISDTQARTSQSSYESVNVLLLTCTYTHIKYIKELTRDYNWGLKTNRSLQYNYLQQIIFYRQTTEDFLKEQTFINGEQTVFSVEIKLAFGWENKPHVFEGVASFLYL